MSVGQYFFTPDRVIDSNGISDGASIYFYATGTTTLQTIYSDESLETPLTNPVVVAAGAAVPSIYLTNTILYRVRIVENDGVVVSDKDPYLGIDQSAVAGLDDALALKPNTSEFISLASPVLISEATAMASDEVNHYAICTATSAEYTVNLPPVTAANIGDAVHIQIHSTSTNLVTIQSAAASGLNIDGKSSRTMWAREDALIMYTGSEWTKIAGNTIPFVAKLNASTSLALSSSFQYIPLAQGEQLNDDPTTIWFDTSWFKSPRESVYKIDINLWASNFVGGDCQVDVGNIMGSGTPSSAAPDVSNFVRQTIRAADTYRILSGNYTRRVPKDNYFCPSVRFNAPATAANVKTLSSNVVITEVPIW